MCQFCLHTKMLSASRSFRKGRCMSQYIRTIHPGSTQVRVCFEGIFLYWDRCKSISFKKEFIVCRLIASECHNCLTHISERKFVETVLMFQVWEGDGRRKKYPFWYGQSQVGDSWFHSVLLFLLHPSHNPPNCSVTIWPVISTGMEGAVSDY